MLGWAILVAYAIGWAASALTLARVLEGDLPARDTTDKGLTITFAMLLALLWPLVIPGAWLWRKTYPTKKRD